MDEVRDLLTRCVASQGPVSASSLPRERDAGLLVSRRPKLPSPPPFPPRLYANRRGGITTAPHCLDLKRSRNLSSRVKGRLNLPPGLGILHSL